MRVAATKAARTIGPGTKRRSNIASPARARNFQPQLLQFCVLFGKRQLRRRQAPYRLGSRFRVGRITFVLRCRHVRPIFPHSPISHAPVAYGRWLGCFLCSFDNVVVKVSMVRAFRNAEACRSDWHVGLRFYAAHARLVPCHRLEGRQGTGSHSGAQFDPCRPQTTSRNPHA